MRKFNRLHCDSTVRARFTDSWGRVITLTGTHAFEYTIHIEGIRTVTETFVNGKLARKDLTIIGATTIEEYYQHFEKD